MVQKTIEEAKDKNISVVGWYHSHPNSVPYPTHKDVVKLKNYQELYGKAFKEQPFIGTILYPDQNDVSSITYYHIKPEIVESIPHTIPNPTIESISETDFLHNLQVLIEDFI